ncbi:MAG: helix-turn-helix domain-containing protein, partial [Candidatus Thermoplasmatota archaeon]|nr:helix-turn-helix domain-containing protein [Candidatus Thermoplasmatota archaeon]
METRSDSGWHSVNEALEKLNISRKTLYDWINSEKITSKKEGKKRLVWINLESDDFGVSPPKHTDPYKDKQLDDLREQLEYFKKQTEMLQGQLAEQSQRHDTIVMKLSTTIETQQLQLQ